VESPFLKDLNEVFNMKRSKKHQIIASIVLVIVVLSMLITTIAAAFII
jgi:hypothetical protein